MNNSKLKKYPVALCLAAIVVVAGCHKKAVAPPPPPPPPPPAAPTATLRANPDLLERGASSSLVWSTSNATSATISGVGQVALNDSQSVTPTESTTYTLTAKGPGGTVEASARVTVTQPPPPPPPPPTPPPAMTEEEMFSANVKDIYFDYDKYKLRTEDSAVVDQDAAFLKQHAGMKVVIVGHCDDRGSAEYNIALGQNRAETMRNALLSDGVSSSRIRVISVGKEQPFCTEENEACWQQNRRAHVMLDR